MEVEISLRRGKTLILDMQSPSAYPTFFVFSLHKAGSVLLNQVITDICSYFDTPVIDIPGVSFNLGIPQDYWDYEKKISEVIQDGYCYLGFRYLPPCLKDNLLLKCRQKILLVRDPRDMLVSHFFSIAYSHVLPLEGEARQVLLSAKKMALDMKIDEYVVQKASFFLDNWNDYHQHLIFDENLKVFRYEDVIFNKEQWIIDILSFLELHLPEEKIKTIAKKYDIIPTEEHRDSHIRKVTPGDHKEKLKKVTVETLNNLLSEILLKYNYLD